MGAEQSTEAPQDAPPAVSNQVTNNQATLPVSVPRALVVCGPSGVGKGTLIKMLMEGSPNYGFSVSHTTRGPREGEQNGRHYHFVTKEQFLKDVSEGKFLEYAEVHTNLYGTSAAAVQSVLQVGKCCVLDIDVQGARAIRKSGLPAIFVFIAPPTMEELERRLTSRGTESKEQVAKRMRNARTEIESLNEKGLFDYMLINDVLEETFPQLKLVAERALAGLEAEPGHVPERVVLEEPEVKSKAGPDEAAPESVPGQTVPVGPVLETGLEKWQDRVALVTGASSGIGWAVCEALALSGMYVVAVARRKDMLEKLQHHVLKQGVEPASFLPVVCDITKDNEVQALPKIVSRRWPNRGIDVLVNNAGLSRNDGSLFDGSTTAWVEMISTNVLGLCMCTREVLQDMKKRNSYGHIINMVGLSGHRIPDGPQGGGFYAATKHAVRCLTDGLRQEARGKGVGLRVSGISPGVVETEFFTVKAYGDPEAARQATSNFKCLQPEDVARAVLWCLSAPEHVEVNDVVIRPSQQLI